MEYGPGKTALGPNEVTFVASGTGRLAASRIVNDALLGSAVVLESPSGMGETPRLQATPSGGSPEARPADSVE